MNIRIRNVVHVRDEHSRNTIGTGRAVCGAWYGPAVVTLQTASAVPQVDSVGGRVIPVFIEGSETEQPATCFLCLAET